MPTASEIKQLATELHDKKIINLDASGRDFMSMTSPVLHKGDEVADWYAVGGSHYVIVCGAQAQLAVDPAKIGAVANPFTK
jgi:hypothetical protein